MQRIPFQWIYYSPIRLLLWVDLLPNRRHAQHSSCFISHRNPFKNSPIHEASIHKIQPARPHHPLHQDGRHRRSRRRYPQRPAPPPPPPSSGGGGGGDPAPTVISNQHSAYTTPRHRKGCIICDRLRLSAIIRDHPSGANACKPATNK